LTRLSAPQSICFVSLCRARSFNVIRKDELYR
jgi:hypothetical protein